MKSRSKSIRRTSDVLLFFLILAIGLAASVSICKAASIKLAWDASTGQDIAGYKLYYGLESRKYEAPVDVGNVLFSQLDNLEAGKRYFFAATAYDTWGRESDFSIEISATLGSVAPAKNLKVVAEKVNITIQTIGK